MSLFDEFSSVCAKHRSDVCDVLIIARGTVGDLSDISGRLRNILHSYLCMVLDNAKHPRILLPVMLPIDVLCASLLVELQAEFGFDLKFYEKIELEKMPLSDRDQWHAISRKTRDENVVDSTLDNNLLGTLPCISDYVLYVLCGTSWYKRARGVLNEALHPDGTYTLDNITIFCI